MSDLEKFWNIIEVKMGCNVPKHIQNILALNGYENAVSIKTLTSEDFNQLQSFARSDMYKRIPENSDLKDYYGSFYSTPEEFIFLPGYIKLIEEIVSFIKCKTASEGPNFFVFKSNINKIEFKRAPTRQGKTKTLKKIIKKM